MNDRVREAAERVVRDRKKALIALALESDEPLQRMLTASLAELEAGMEPISLDDLKARIGLQP